MRLLNSGGGSLRNTKGTPSILSSGSSQWQAQRVFITGSQEAVEHQLSQRRDQEGRGVDHSVFPSPGGAGLMDLGGKQGW